MALDPQTNIESLYLSKRTTNALLKNGVTTAGELAALSEEELMAMRGMGVTCVEEIKVLKQRAKDGNEVSTPTYGLGEYWSSLRRDGRSYSILADYYNNPNLTLQEIGDQYQVSRSRIQQIIVAGTKKIQKAFLNGTISRDIIATIDTYADNRSEVHTLNLQDDVFSGVGIAYLVAAFRPSIYKVYTSRFINGYWFIKADDNIDKVLEILVEELKCRPEPLSITEVKQLYSVSEEMLMSIKGVIEKDGYVTHRTNRTASGTDRFQIITRYLESIDRPASVGEIVSQTSLGERQVRGALCNKNLYINVGKSLYDLADRTYDDALIEDLTVKLLMAEQRALKTEAIVEYVRRYKEVNDFNVSYELLRSSKIYSHDGYVLLDGWSLDKIERKVRSVFSINLEDAVLEIINASDELFDYDKIYAALEKYNGAVSTNSNSIKTTLVRLADKGLISRVGGRRTGCYMRKPADANNEPQDSPVQLDLDFSEDNLI